MEITHFDDLIFPAFPKRAATKCEPALNGGEHSKARYLPIRRNFSYFRLLVSSRSPAEKPCCDEMRWRITSGLGQV